MGGMKHRDPVAREQDKAFLREDGKAMLTLVVRWAKTRPAGVIAMGGDLAALHTTPCRLTEQDRGEIAVLEDRLHALAAGRSPSRSPHRRRPEASSPHRRAVASQVSMSPLRSRSASPRRRSRSPLPPSRRRPADSMQWKFCMCH